jgi:uncharacterized protein
MFSRLIDMKKIAIFITLISVLVCSAVYAADIPAPTSEFYVNDTANVLSDKTERTIIDKNIALYEATGAQIVVVTVDYTHTASIADYAYELFNEYKIGSAEKNNGLLLLLSIGDDDYYVLQGEGLERTLSSGTLSYLLYEHLEPYFAKQQYDEGVLSIFNVLYKEMLAIHNTTIEYEDVYPPQDNYYYPEDFYNPSPPLTFFDILVTVFAVFRFFFFFIVIIGVLSAIFGRRKSTRRSDVARNVMPVIGALGYMNTLKNMNNSTNYSSFNNNSSTVNRSNYYSGGSSYSSGRSSYSGGSSFRSSSSSSRSSFSSGSRSSSGGGGSSRGGGAGRGGR